MENASPAGWNGKSRGGGFGYAFFVLLIKYGGIRAAYAFLALVVVYFIPCAPRATAAVWDYCRRRLGYGRWKAALALFRHYYRFGQTIIDKVAIGGGAAGRYDFRFDNYDAFIALLESGKGILMLGAHVGCWEAGARFFGKYGRKINIVMYDAEYARIREVVERHTGVHGYKVIPINGSTLDTMLRIKVALNGGEYVCFQGDRYLSPRHTLRRTFLGSEARFPEGPFLLGSKLQVPVVVYYAMRERGRRYRFHFEQLAREGERLSSEELLGRYTASLEAVVRRYPEQWFNFYDFWK